MKNKLKTIMVSILLLFLFISSSYVSASTRVSNVIYPDTVKIGKTFEITISFTYESSYNALYGDNIWLFYATGDEPILDYTRGPKITVPIDDLIDFPKPTEVIVEVDTSEIVCAVNDTFLFRIKYINGFVHEDVVLNSGSMYSDSYRLTIIDTKSVGISAVFSVIPLLFLSVIVLIRKKKKRGKMK